MHNPPLILVVDDEENFREVFSRELASLGFATETASSGAEGVKKAAELQPDLILMDVMMPGELNGVQAALAIKGNPETNAIKISFLSSADNPWPAVVGDRAEISKAFGMEDFIPKTENLDVFVAKVKGFLGVQ